MKVSIVTVCYNAEKYIRSAIESVISQSYNNIEYIVIDGASSDSTIDIVNEYSEYISLIVSEADLGIYDAMNKGITLASGDVIGILNADDFYRHKNVITQMMEQFHCNPNVSMIMANIEFVEQADLNRVTRLYSSNNFSPWMLRFGFMPAHPATFIKKSAYDLVGKYKLGYKIAADFDMFIRLLLKEKFKYVKWNQPVVRMRIGGVSSSGFHSHIVTTKEMLRSLKENNIYSNIFCVLARLPIKYFKMELQMVKSYFLHHNH